MQYKEYKGGVEPMEKIAVLIPCYNGEQFVERCLINVLETSYEKSTIN